MAATFLKALGKSVGDSLVEEDLVEFARELMDQGSRCGVTIRLPSDVVVAFHGSSELRHVSVDEIPESVYITDIGKETVRSFSREVSLCRTIIWNGPMGIFEKEEFAHGTNGIVNALGSLDAVTIIGGGSTAEAVEALNLGSKMSHVSSGGGAMLEFLEGADLPGIAALPSKVPLTEEKK